MEEILASIRRIISEDDAPAADPATAAAPEAAPEPAETSPALMDETPSMQEPAAVEDDVLELTDRYEAPAAGETIGDLDVLNPEPDPFPTSFAEPELEPEPVAAPEPAPAPAAAPVYDSLVGDSAAASAASAFAGLAASFRQPEAIESSGGTGPTIEDLARALLRPMLREWLDANLPGIVEAAVSKEVARIARSAG